MMPLSQRIVMFEVAAKASESPRLKQMYSETADVLKALQAQYLALYEAAKDTIERSNGMDPAMNILQTEMDRQGHNVRRVTWIGEE